MMKKRIANKIAKYRFQFRHITVLLVVLISFQVILSFFQKSALSSFLDKTQVWYQRDLAERMANLSTTSLELLVGNMNNDVNRTKKQEKKIVQAFDIIFSQQLLEPNVKETCLIILKDNVPTAINEGKDFYNFLTKTTSDIAAQNKSEYALELFISNFETLKRSEEIFTVLDNSNNFHILVPFIPYGEFVGVFYMRNKPNFEFITHEVISNYNEVALIYTSLIFLGLLAMYYISSSTVKERDEARQLFFKEREQHLKDSIDHEKESLFTKRIYHTHHKAEKVMGFIKEDLRLLNSENIEDTKDRTTKYANFVSRVIYDMKWYNPPVQTIRNQVFNTDINGVIKFITDNLFLRLSKSTNIFAFDLNLDNSIPTVHVNEFVVWEILEPLIQNSIDHSIRKNIIVKIETVYDSKNKKSLIYISDNGEGINSTLLEIGEKGIKKIFSENVSTKVVEERNTGYGCYIAFQMATVRCGWKMDVENLKDGGCKFTIEIQN